MHTCLYILLISIIHTDIATHCPVEVITIATVHAYMMYTAGIPEE